MDKKLKYSLMEIIQAESNIEQDFIIDLIKKYAPMIDIQALQDKEYKRMANQLISSLRDETGVRDVFVIKTDEEMTEYLNVARTKEVNDLYKVRNRLDSNIKGNQKSLDKVNSRLFLLENQISIADFNVEVDYKQNQ